MKVYDSSGYYISTWSIATFSSPQGITADNSQNPPVFYVADSGNNRIVETVAGGGSIALSWGSLGTGNGQFTSLASVAVDSSGAVYATDYPSSSGFGVGRVQKFDGTGNFLSSWGGVAPSGNGQFTSPGGVAFDASGNIYVCDYGNSRIEKFDANGSYLGQWGSSSVFKPWYGSLAVDNSGNIYVPDYGNGYVQVLNSSLTHVKNIGAGLLASPTSVALDAAGNIYVADLGKGKVFVFDSNGYTTHTPQSIGTQATTFPAPDGQLVTPVGVVVDSAGNVYVSDLPIFTPRTNVIQKFDAKGNFVKAWGTAGTGDGQISLPLGIGIDKYDNVFVCDFPNRRVEKFDGNGNFIGKWGGVGVGNGTFGWPFGVAINSSGKVLVSDVTNDLAQLFGPAQ